MVTMLNAFHEAVESWGEDYSVYANKIKKWDFQKFFNIEYDNAVPMRCGFQVLNHGDCWVNNFMIKHNQKGNPIDVLLIDFQVCNWGSPATDLQYFFISSLNEDIKLEYYDYLIKYYHSELVNNLKMLNYVKPIPTLEELFIDILEKGLISVHCLTSILFVNKLNSEKEITMDQLFNGGKETGELMKLIYQNENYAAACKKWLPFLDRRGFLDTLL